VSGAEALLVGFGWIGWALALAALSTLWRRLERVADAEHELRGAVTAIGIGLDGEPSPLLRLQLDRMTAALADLAEVRGACRASSPELEAGRLAQVLGNVIANAVEHGVGPVEVQARSEGRMARLELVNRDRVNGGDHGSGTGRGRGIVIAQRAAGELGGRVRVESEGGRTRTIVELPAEAPADERDPPSDDLRPAA